MDDHDEDRELGTDPPSRGLALLMIVVGILFLLPFIFVSLASGPFFSLGGFISALLTVGWTLGLGVVFLVYGWKRFRVEGASEPAEHPRQDEN